MIDADGHVFEPESVWEEYLESKFQAQRPRIVLDNRGTTRYMLEGRLIPPAEGRGAWAPEGIREATNHRDGGFDPIKQVRRLPKELRKFLAWDRGLEMAHYKDFSIATQRPDTDMNGADDPT